MCNFPSVVECRPSGLEWNIHLDSFTLFEFTILFINLPIGSWFLNIYSRLLITWTLANLNLAVPRSKKLFLKKSMRKNRSSSNQKICENYNFDQHLFLNLSLVVCWQAYRIFDHSCTVLCSKYASHKVWRFYKSIRYMYRLVNLKNCIAAWVN